MAVHLHDIEKSFGDLPVFRGLSLEIPEDEVTAVLGPSGCGKTTLLNLLSGTLLPERGRVEGVSGRKISYLFQEPRLLPWRTVYGNVDLVLRKELKRPEREHVVQSILHEVGLDKFIRYYPDSLSGGMRQRVAMARAFAYPAGLLLMDEPFQALDLILKLTLVETFRTAWKSHRRTGIFVTHDIHEALILGDTVIVIGGRPATVRLRVKNDVPFPDRSLKNPSTLALEKTLYDSLLSVEMV